MNACAHCATPIAKGTLCPECVRELREEYYDDQAADDLSPVEEYDTDIRASQHAFSERVVIVACLVAFGLVGLAIGAALANMTAPLP